MAIRSPEKADETECWDQLYEALAAQPRRMIIFSLLREPEDGQLSLPEAAMSHDSSVEPATLSTQLQHHHLPKLADAGYVRWTRDPFRVRRGPHFEEPALVVSQMTNNSIEYPQRLREECVVIGEVKTNDAN